MHSDHTITLRPKGVSENERKGACKKAKQIVGSKYDVNFNDIEEGNVTVVSKDEVEARIHLPEGEKLVKEQRTGLYLHRSGRLLLVASPRTAASF